MSNFSQIAKVNIEERGYQLDYSIEKLRKTFNKMEKAETECWETVDRNIKRIEDVKAGLLEGNELEVLNELKQIFDENMEKIKITQMAEKNWQKAKEDFIKKMA